MAKAIRGHLSEPSLRRLLAPRTVVGGTYVVHGPLGTGGMGMVYAGEHIALGLKIAIKVLHGDATRDEGAILRLRREARSTASLRSRHTVRVLDFGTQDDGAPFLVMELLEGADIAAVLKRHGPLDVSVALEIVLQTCKSLAEAHGQGLVHRDLKPSNLFLARTLDGTTLVKVLDFGIAKLVALSGATKEASLTATGKLIGSVTYMSPEQVRAEAGIDGRADIWALGNILYELLTGGAPFDADATTAVLARILTDEPAPLAEQRDDVPPELAEVVRICLHKRADDRFTTVAALAERLEAVQATVGGEASLDHLLPDPSGTSADDPAPEAACHSRDDAVRSSAQTDGAARERRRRGMQFWATTAVALLLVIGGLALRVRRPTPSGDETTAVRTAVAHDRPLVGSATVAGSTLPTSPLATASPPPVSSSESPPDRPDADVPHVVRHLPRPLAPKHHDEIKVAAPPPEQDPWMDTRH